MNARTNAQVHITTGTDPRVVIDGVDITKSVLAEGFGVYITDGGRNATVTMTIRTDRLVLDMPDAEVKTEQFRRLCDPEVTA